LRPAGAVLVPAIDEDRIASTQARAAMAGTYLMIDVPTFDEFGGHHREFAGSAGRAVPDVAIQIVR
jgi:hypothetical protein